MALNFWLRLFSRSITCSLPHWRRRAIAGLGIAAFLVTAIAIPLQPAFGQVSLPTAEVTVSKVPQGVFRHGNLESTYVKSPLTHKDLFEIAAPTVFDRSDPEKDRQAVENRATFIESNLERAMLDQWKAQLERASNPSDPPIPPLVISEARLNNLLVLVAGSDRISNPFRLLTITAPDAEFHGKTAEELARAWKEILQKDFDLAENSLRPGTLGRKFLLALKILAIAAIASTLCWLVQQALHRQQKHLRLAYETEVEIGNAKKP